MGASVRIEEPAAFPLGPTLPPYAGEQFLPALPGIFADGAPDRWGRTLLERREALVARREGPRLRELEHWARELELGLSEEMSEEDRWIAMLVAPGSSLGGARPKASFLDGDELWIAKFPSAPLRLGDDTGGKARRLRIATTTCATTVSSGPPKAGASLPPSTSTRRCKSWSTAWHSTIRCGRPILRWFGRLRRFTGSPRIGPGR